ncbi:hypothetical protein F0562_028805 [Nyssa sinensis]|uniref:inorganic diphosphatase n=1 Tax=Nyssa sinensis TaxID=561372 RepID=A0A5J5B3F0_9ASTE|nr:hypothetical protein F0562_028805 [Nyssa sinensis]
MAATRVMATVTSTTTTTSLLSKGPFRRSHILSLSFNNRLVSKKQLFACSALYKPELHIKEEGQPETLDYRVFFVDNSGKKVSPWHDIPLQLGDGHQKRKTPILSVQYKLELWIASTNVGRPIICKAVKLRVHLEITIQSMLLRLVKVGTLTAIRDWFRDYKIPDGKPANKFGLGNKAANKDYALKVIAETNESWAKLVKRSIPAGGLSLV